MAIFSISNDELTIKVKSDGGELTSILDNETRLEYLWCGDSNYWGRQAPILFPFVGSLKNKEYFIGEDKYSMGQHGFARDMEFECVTENDNEIWCTLESNEITKAKFPFDFKLRLGYILDGRTLKVVWEVTNPSDKRLPFSIGGHPAFNCPIDDRKQNSYFIQTNVERAIQFGAITDNGLLKRNVRNLLLVNGDRTFHIAEDLFNNDALVIEDNQINTMSLLTPDKVPYVTMKFDMPLCGIWSPAHKNAPFVCLEPWIGRCDADDFEGDIYEREYGTILAPNRVFETDYTLTFGKVK